MTIAKFAGRHFGDGFTFDITGPALFPKENISIWKLAAYVNSNTFQQFLDVSLSGMHYSNGVVAIMPCLVTNPTTDHSEVLAKKLINISIIDWNSFETSWDFDNSPLIKFREINLKRTCQIVREHWIGLITDTQRLETENNRIFIEAYGLQDELTPEVPLKEITLTCNPHYRYGGDKTEEELEALLLADTMKEFISYSVGCMFGRYSLDKPGLILANQGETVEDYIRKVDEYRVSSSENGQKGDDNENKELPGFNSVAEGDGCGRDDLSSNKTVYEGGSLRDNKSDSASGSLDSVEYRRRTGTEIDKRFSTVSDDSSRFKSGSRDTTNSISPTEISDRKGTNTNPGNIGRNIPNDKLTESKTQITNYSLLNTQYSFLPDDDNVIPILEDDWFSDDITERFYKFLRVTFGEEHFDENLKFIEDAIGKTVRKYFLKDFYNDHIRRYKKRPIYWLFSSPKGSFNALIYMHRYRPDTVSVILNGYLREFREKLTSHLNQLDSVSINGASTAGEKTKALKDMEKIKKILDEINKYERDILYPLATKKIEIDLDDGVKVNYPKFGKALKNIVGL